MQVFLQALRHAGQVVFGTGAGPCQRLLTVGAQNLRSKLIFLFFGVAELVVFSGIIITLVDHVEFSVELVTRSVLEFRLFLVE